MTGDAIARIHAHIEGAGDVRKRAHELVAGLEPAEMLHALERGTSALGDEARGMLVLEGLPDPREAPPELLDAVLAAAADRHRDAAFRFALLDYLETAVRHGATVTGYEEALAGVARAEADRPPVRARALRGIRFGDRDRLQPLLRELVTDATDGVADTAAAVAADLARLGDAIEPSLAAAVVERASPRLPGTLRALAALGDVPAAREELDRLALAAREPREVAHVLNAAGDALPAPALEAVRERALQLRRPETLAAAALAGAAEPQPAPGAVTMPDGRTLSVDELHETIAEAG